MVIVSFLISKVSASENIAFYFAIPYMLVFMFSGLIGYYTKCPRCKNVYSHKEMLRNPWNQKCLHCGLQIKADRAAS